MLKYSYYSDFSFSSGFSDSDKLTEKGIFIAPFAEKDGVGGSGPFSAEFEESTLIYYSGIRILPQSADFCRLGKPV